MEQLEEQINRVKAGETQEYVFIVKAYQKQIYYYCWRLLGNRQEAEDAVQDVFVSAYEKLNMYKPVVSFSSWLYKLAYHQCLNLIRRRKLHLRLINGLFQQTTSAASAEQECEFNLFSEPLSKALGKLSIDERNLLVLRVFEEKSFIEIGEILAKSPDAIKKKYKRTKTKLQHKMKEFKEEELCANYTSLLKTKS